MLAFKTIKKQTYNKHSNSSKNLALDALESLVFLRNVNQGSCQDSLW